MFFLLYWCVVIITCCYNVGKFCSLLLLSLCFTIQIEKKNLNIIKPFLWRESSYPLYILNEVVFLRRKNPLCLNLGIPIYCLLRSLSFCQLNKQGAFSVEAAKYMLNICCFIKLTKEWWLYFILHWLMPVGGEGMYYYVVLHTNLFHVCMENIFIFLDKKWLREIFKHKEILWIMLSPFLRVTNVFYMTQAILA